MWQKGIKNYIIETPPCGNYTDSVNNIRFI